MGSSECQQELSEPFMHLFCSYRDMHQVRTGSITSIHVRVYSVVYRSTDSLLRVSKSFKPFPSTAPPPPPLLSPILFSSSFSWNRWVWAADELQRRSAGAPDSSSPSTARLGRNHRWPPWGSGRDDDRRPPVARGGRSCSRPNPGRIWAFSFLAVGWEPRRHPLPR
jgi:hypothetical protein